MPRRRPSPSSSAARARRRRRRRWPSPACCATCCATRASASASCRSSPTRPAPSAWTRCSRSSRSTRRSARSTSRSTPLCCSRTRRTRDGQILEEGITEAGSMASFTAAGTSYATWGKPMMPFFIFYSMFGFQRVGDLIWAAGDMRGRGFLLGATAGRTTLNGEGLQHQDGHSHSCWRRRFRTSPPTTRRSPTRSPLIVEDGIERMYGPDAEDVFYYLTLYNENYVMPPMPDGVRRRDLPRPVPLRRRARRHRRRRRPRSCSRARRGRRRIEARRPARRRPRRGRRVLERDVVQERCARTRCAAERWNRLHPTETPRTPVRHRGARRRRRPGRRRHRLHEGGARPDRPLGAGTVRRRSAPTATAAPTPATRCAATSRSTPPTSSSPCSRPWPPPATPRPRRSPTPSPATASTPTPSTRYGRKGLSSGPLMRAGRLRSRRPGPGRRAGPSD